MIIIPGMGNQTDVWTYNLKERIIHCVGEIEEDMAESIIAQLLYLSSEGNEDIQLFINSPGGDIDAGMAIYYTMK